MAHEGSKTVILENKIGIPSEGAEKARQYVESCHSLLNIKPQPPYSPLTQKTVQWHWQPFCACVFLSAEWIRRELGWEPGQCFGRRRWTGQCMTNECVMNTVEPGHRPIPLICVVSTAQVNLMTKTPSPPTPQLPQYLVKEAGSRLDFAPRWRGGLRGRTEGGKRWQGNYGKKRWNKREARGCETSKS